MKRPLKKWLRRCILIAIGAATLLLCKNAYTAWSSMEPRCNTVSVRFEQNAVYQEVLEAMRSDKEALPTFWGRTEIDDLTSENQAKPKTAELLYFYGKGEDVLSAQFLTGNFPPASIDGGCVISAALSEELWGTRDSLGKKLWSGTRAYLVHGVFDSAKKTLAVQRQPREDVVYSAMELTVSPEQDGRRIALNFIKQAGLPPPKYIINDSGFCWFLYQLALLPFYVLLGMALWRIREVAWPKWGKYALLLYSFLLIICLLLFSHPYLIQTIGQSLTSPGFWQALLQPCRVRLGELITLLPTYRDSLLQRQTVTLLVNAVLATGGMIYLVRQAVYPYCLPVARGKKTQSG